MKDGITLIVLAAGIGKRLWPLTTSKALFPFFGLPMFAHTIADVPSGISKMIIVTNAGNDGAIRSYQFPIPTSTVIQKDPSGMAGAMLSCRSALGNSPVIVINVNDVVDPGLISGVIPDRDVFGVIPGWKPPQYLPLGYLSLSGDRVTGIVEKPGAGNEPSPYADIVCHYIADGSEFITELAKTKSDADDKYEKALTSLMMRHEFTLYTYEGNFAPLKYPWHVLDILGILLQRVENYKGKNVTVKHGVTIEGPVYIEDNVKIFEHAKIVGPCYIGKNTIIGNNTIIRQSHIGADSVIGFNCDVTRSYIGDNCWLHSNYIGDSVLSGNISMGAGATLANLRLDDGEISSVVGNVKIATGRTKLGAVLGSGVRIGVNASVMPGVKIGSHTFIGSGVILDRDIPADSFCMAKPQYTVTKNLRKAPASRQSFRNKL